MVEDALMMWRQELFLCGLGAIVDLEGTLSSLASAPEYAIIIASRKNRSHRAILTTGLIDWSKGCFQPRSRAEIAATSAITFQLNRHIEQHVILIQGREAVLSPDIVYHVSITMSPFSFKLLSSAIFMYCRWHWIISLTGFRQHTRRRA